MLCLRLMRSLARVVRSSEQLPSMRYAVSCRRYFNHALRRTNPTNDTASRTFTTRTLVRPSILPPLATCRSLMPCISCGESPIAATPVPLDILPKISSHPALAGIQVRNGPRNTFDPSHLVRKRRAGFLARKRSRAGRNILMRRRLKKRSTLSH